MKIKNSKNFIDFCQEIGIDSFYSHYPLSRIKYRENVNKSQKSLNYKNKIEKLELLDNLKKRIEILDCSIKKTSTNLVFSDGDPYSDLMLIGEAPGSEEDRKGVPFVGQAGELLNEIMKSININRNDFYITNILFWRPPGNRNPSIEEIDLCIPLVKEHIKIINPKYLILLGNVALKSLLDVKEGITKVSGERFEYISEKKKIPCWPVFHPAFLLRNPIAKKKMWLDICKIHKYMKNYARN